MIYKIILTSRAQKDFGKLDSSLRKRIMDGLNRLSSGHENSDVKKLEVKDFFRLRVGNYRIIFKYEANYIIISKIAHRKDIYKKK